MSYIRDRIRQRYVAGTDGATQIQRYTDAGILTAAEYEEITGAAYTPSDNLASVIDTLTGEVG